MTHKMTGLTFEVGATLNKRRIAQCKAYFHSTVSLLNVAALLIGYTINMYLYSRRLLARGHAGHHCKSQTVFLI